MRSALIIAGAALLLAGCSSAASGSRLGAGGEGTTAPDSSSAASQTTSADVPPSQTPSATDQQADPAGDPSCGGFTKAVGDALLGSAGSFSSGEGAPGFYSCSDSLSPTESVRFDILSGDYLASLGAPQKAVNATVDVWNGMDNPGVSHPSGLGSYAVMMFRTGEPVTSGKYIGWVQDGKAYELTVFSPVSTPDLLVGQARKIAAGG